MINLGGLSSRPKLHSLQLGIVVTDNSTSCGQKKDAVVSSYLQVFSVQFQLPIMHCSLILNGENIQK